VILSLLFKVTVTVSVKASKNCFVSVWALPVLSATPFISSALLLVYFLHYPTIS
jgi:hypothetical protein